MKWNTLNNLIIYVKVLINYQAKNKKSKERSFDGKEKNRKTPEKSSEIKEKNQKSIDKGIKTKKTKEETREVQTNGQNTVI